MGIKVLIVDDSAVIRTAFTEILRQSPDITEVLTAADPLFAMQKMEHFTPDVVVLDIQMPRMDGITFLKKCNLMQGHHDGLDSLLFLVPRST